MIYVLCGRERIPCEGLKITMCIMEKPMKTSVSLLRVSCVLITLLFLSTSSVAKKKKGKKSSKGAKEQVVSGKVTKKKDDTDITIIYQIGKMSVSKSCADEVEDFEGKNVTAKCRVHQGRILQIISISEAKGGEAKKKKKK